MTGNVRRIPTALVRDMSEAEFQKRIVTEARRHGWLVNHCYRSKLADGTWRTTTTYKGYPDLTLVKRGRNGKPGQFLQLELKKVGESATPEQRRWIGYAQSVPGVRAYVVDPTHWPEVLDLLTKPWPWPTVPH